MAINSITGLGLNNILPGIKTETTAGGESFGKLFDDAISNTIDTELDDKSSALNLLTDGNAEIHNTLIDAEEAELSLRLMLQMRNKVMDSYTEIMRMQV